uniref:Uncharacterized protein n=1 Tax=Cannabis sativa TaxID=3483 RepID=A0A803QP36_CANSA
MQRGRAWPSTTTGGGTDQTERWREDRGGRVVWSRSPSCIERDKRGDRVERGYGSPVWFAERGREGLGRRSPVWVARERERTEGRTFGGWGFGVWSDFDAQRVQTVDTG